MMRTRCYWTSRVADERRPRFPVHRGHLDLDVAVVGGGLVGCTTALTFASAGLRTGLFEAKRIGQHASGAAPGVILPAPAVTLTTLQATLGRRGARAVWDASRQAAFDFASLLRGLGVRCELEPAQTIDYLSEGEDGRPLERERDLRADMGMEGQWLTPRARARLAASTSGAVRAKGAALFDPYRASLGLARASVARGALVFERSPVARTRVRRRERLVEFSTERGTVTASRAVIATGEPGRQFKSLARRFTRLVGYRVLTPRLPSALRRRLPASSVVLREAACPGHLLRWTKDRRLLFAGQERLRLPERLRSAALAQQTTQLVEELSLLVPALAGIQVEHGWDASICASDDGLPYVGPHRHYPRHLFALGVGRSDGGTALLAAQILLRHHQGAPAKTDAWFGFSR